MYGRSAAFDDAVRYGGNPVYNLFAQSVDVSTGKATPTLTGLVIDGSPNVQVDCTADSRRVLDLNIIDTDGTLTPKTAFDPLSPYGNELVLQTGFMINGAPELIQQGVFRIQNAKGDGLGGIDIKTLDRSSVVKSARWEQPYTIADGTNAVVAITTILQDRYPGLIVLSDNSDATIPLTVFQEGSAGSSDPWADASGIATAASLDVFMDNLGRGIIRYRPDPTAQAPVWTYQPAADSLLLTSDLTLNADGVYNVFIASASGTGTDVTLSGKAEITDPSSPIYPARFGRKPVFYASPLLTTQDMCDQAAQTLMSNQAGSAEVIGFSAAPHPAHDARDVVQVVNAELGITDQFVLQSFPMPVLMDSPVSYFTGTAQRVS